MGATGHSRPTYFVVVHGDDYSMLGDPNFITMVEDYIALAPSGNNKALDPEFQRFHGASDHTSFYDNSPLYSEKVDPGHSHFLNHSRAPTAHLWRYAADVIAADVRVFYESTKYDWIQ